MLVRDHMTREVITLAPDTEILRALIVLASNDIAGAPVLDANDDMVGILTEKDCIRSALEATYHSVYAGLVRDFMSEEVVSESELDLARYANDEFSHPEARECRENDYEQNDA